VTARLASLGLLLGIALAPWPAPPQTLAAGEIRVSLLGAGSY
jgi:hypothetical protein